MPECRSVIAMAFRVMRGSLRGVEEGPFFSNYSSMGYGGLTYLYIPLTVINLAKEIEDQGYEAIPYGHQSDWRAIDNVGRLKPRYSRPVAAGRAAPDVMVHLRIAAYLAGLGEIGFSKMFLTPQFGPRQRIGIVLTEAELEPDPLYEGPPLCNRCLACARDCPAQAFDPQKTVKVTLAGREVEWMDLDGDACDLAFRGAERDDSVVPEDGYLPHGGVGTRPGWWSPFCRKPRNLYTSGQAVCGARGCTRACMISLEKRGVLRNRFHQPFRRRPTWRVDWAAEPEGRVTKTPPERTKGEAD
jgi:ferredoxin